MAGHGRPGRGYGPREPRAARPPVVADGPDPERAGPDEVDPLAAEGLFNRLFAIRLTLRRVAQVATGPVRADRVDAVIEEIDALISDLRRAGNGDPVRG